MFAIDFEDPKIKNAIRAAQYFVLTVLVIAGASLLVLAGRGYDVDPRTGEVIQNGLVLINTSPEGATVTINGIVERSDTPGRFSFPAGDYDITLSRDGYRDWTKRIGLSGSSVEWLYYPLLIPDELVTKNVGVFSRVEFFSRSPNAQRYLLRQTSSRPSLSLVEVTASGISREQTLTLPGDLFINPLGSATPDTGAYDIVGWAADNRHALVLRELKNTKEYLLIDVEDVTESRNLTAEFDLDLDNVRFIKGDATQFYTLVDDDLRRLNLSQDTISTPIAREVTDYALHQDRYVAYLQTIDAKRSRLAMFERSDEQIEVARLDKPAANYLIDLGEYDKDINLVLADLQTGSVSVYVNPQQNLENIDIDSIITLKNPATKADSVSFSGNGRFVGVQADNQFVVYDFDQDERYGFELPFQLTEAYEAHWADGYRYFVHDRLGTLHLVDFDGSNLQPLLESDPNFLPLFDNRQSSLLSIGPPSDTSAKSAFLHWTELIIAD